MLNLFLILALGSRPSSCQASINLVELRDVKAYDIGQKIEHFSF